MKGGMPAVCCLSTAAQLLRHQQGVIAIDLQQMEQEEPVSMGIQTHGPHTLLGQCGIRAPCYFTEGLENSVVLLQEKPQMDFKKSRSLRTCSRALIPQFTYEQLFFLAFYKLFIKQIFSFGFYSLTFFAFLLHLCGFYFMSPS